MGKKSVFKTTWRSRRWRSALRARENRPPGFRQQPECIVLEPRPGVQPSEKPPVRIFVGTEPAQYRAERIFIYSIKQTRDPARRYEIYLMKELTGFERGRWKTGFTMYRFAIADFAGRAGRAIYNDVDQIYLGDPGEMFDLDMGEHGFLSITRRDTSVMLIDCARMGSIWTADAARHELKKYFRARALEVEGSWGPLPPQWNSRDHEYVRGQSKLFHFTTLQMQPWRPFPDDIIYNENPHGELWYSLERDADAAGYHVFTRQHPSERYRRNLELYRDLHTGGAGDLGLAPAETFDGHSLPRHSAAIGEVIASCSARTVLDYGCGKGSKYGPGPDGAPVHIRSMKPWGDVQVRLYDPGHEPYAQLPEEKFDGVLCTDVLEHIPEEDIPWIIDELFAHGSLFVYAAVACYPARKTLADGQNAHCTVRDTEWWREHFAAAAARYPGVRWELHARQKGPLRKYYETCSGNAGVARKAS